MHCVLCGFNNKRNNKENKNDIVTSSVPVTNNVIKTGLMI